MSDLDEMADMLGNLAAMLEALERQAGRAEPEADACCETDADAHEHGRAQGWDAAMEQVKLWALGEAP